jgi:hypothetical protein
MSAYFFQRSVHDECEANELGDFTDRKGDPYDARKVLPTVLDVNVFRRLARRE